MNAYQIKQFKESLNTNRKAGFVTSLDTLVQVAIDNKLEIAKTLVGKYPDISSIALAEKIVKELGWAGRAYIKVVAGKEYVVFKGYAGYRSIFKGVTYLASNAKVVDMAIGTNGIKSFVKSGARLTLQFTVSMKILEAILSDKFILHEFLGDLTSAILKIGVTTVLSAAAAAIVGAMTTIAIAPVAVAIVVGVAATWVLDKADEKYQFTERLIDLFKKLERNTIDVIADEYNKMEKAFRWQLFKGGAIGRGIFY